MKNDSPLLEVRDLTVSFHMYNRGLDRRVQKVISDLSITVAPGEILAVAGSSGSGKSLLAHAVLGILPDNAEASGAMFYRGEPLTAARQRELRGRDIALIPQSVAYLDPLMRVGPQVTGGKPELASRAREVLARLGLAPAVERLYPFQLSGGMARRVLFSTAVVSDARLIIADEPTPGMHLEQAVEALSVLRELADGGRGVVLITHDIDLALQVADRIAVFYAGTTVEQAPVADFLAGPEALRHPYSRALWAAMPQNGFRPIPGFKPGTGEQHEGCLFAPRCSERTGKCQRERPPLRRVRGGLVRCGYGT